MIGENKKLIIIPHIEIHSANALSSALTIGFPAMTAWLGATHALQRKLNERNTPVRFIGTGVVSHKMNLQTYKGNSDYTHSILATANPLDKQGNRPPFIEQARCHLDVTLIIQFDDIETSEREQMLTEISHILHASMKIAGGDIIGFKDPYCMNFEEGDVQQLAKIQRALMPGYALIERRDLMRHAMATNPDALEALIDFLAVHHSCDADADADADADVAEWHSYRKSLPNKPSGWIVPIAVGFHAVNEIDSALNSRDASTPHRFAESLITLGEFIMPHRMSTVEDLLWRYTTEGDFYRCQQQSQSNQTEIQAPLLRDNESEF